MNIKKIRLNKFQQELLKILLENEYNIGRYEELIAFLTARNEPIIGYLEYDYYINNLKNNKEEILYILLGRKPIIHKSIVDKTINKYLKIPK